MNKTQCTQMDRLFSPALDGRLEAGEQMIFDNHLRGCDSCQSEFDQYQRLFSAVASLSGSSMPGPVPFPETVRAFRVGDGDVPWWGRFGSTAAAAVLLAIVGLGAFQAGRNRVRDESGTDVASLDEIEIVQPTEETASQLKGFHQDVESLPVLLEAADRYPDREVQKLVAAYVSGIRDEGKLLLGVDATSLGSLHRPTKKVANDLVFCLSEMDDHLRVARDPKKAIRWAKRHFYQTVIVDRRHELKKMVRGFRSNDLHGLTVRRHDPVTHQFELALRSYTRGDAQQGRVHLNLVKPELLNIGSQKLFHVIGELERVFSAKPGDGGTNQVTLTLTAPQGEGSWSTEVILKGLHPKQMQPKGRNLFLHGSRKDNRGSFFFKAPETRSKNTQFRWVKKRARIL